MLQEIITDPGLFHAESENWQLVYGKQKYEFREEDRTHQGLQPPQQHSQQSSGAYTRP